MKVSESSAEMNSAEAAGTAKAEDVNQNTHVKDYGMTIHQSDMQTKVIGRAANQLPVIAGVEITTDDAGRFNLNALHKAHLSMNPGLHKNSKQPADWLKLDQTKELIDALFNSEDFHSWGLNQEDQHFGLVVTKVGRYGGGTFAHELLAISYAGWISPAFQLQVNQVFLDFRTGKIVPVSQIPDFSNPAAAARAWAEEYERGQALAIENKQQQEQIHSLESLFRQGMTIPQFCKMLNGVNSQQVQTYFEERGWLFNESKSGQRWRATSYARDRYLTEEQMEIRGHGFDPFVQFKPVLLQKGAVRVYQIYLKGELPMKKHWDGLFTQDKVIKGAA
ncbi:KilA-N domain-containing protein [Aeromonas sp. RU39B]|uniref:KilA-N domain-containing protein n=1 Tax=Aeromonas sp. RU39B TaxID=1907416 RepID=UPI0009541B50|nr:KilA-N domain-containing protein [Aeromonas sp. RU39B]SIR40498.1 KilA-N domain-containing protein [Aeromonas sp. RU39B]